MQYANTIVNHQAGFNLLTYSIPSQLLAHLAVGSVIMVPLGKSIVHGVVVSFVRHVDTRVAPKLKPIHSIIYPNAFIPEYIIRASFELQKKYNLGLNDILFSLLPSFPKRKEPAITSYLSKDSGYHIVEYVIPPLARCKAYATLAKRCRDQDTSLLIIAASASAAEGLSHFFTSTSHSVYLVPRTQTPKQQRDHFVGLLPSVKPKVIIGARGALVTPLGNFGAVVIDEPWLPGQKEERTPKLWSIFQAQALCHARRIPLYLGCSLPWPETKLVDASTRYIRGIANNGVVLIPNRSIKEALIDFFARHDEHNRNFGIIVRDHKDSPKLDSKTQHQTMTDIVREELRHLKIKGTARLFAPEELLQFSRFDAAMVIGFDAFLSVVDFRSSVYLATLLSLIRGQAKKTHLLTRYPDEWTRLIQLNPDHFITDVLLERKKHQLPSYTQFIEVSSSTKKNLLLQDITPLVAMGMIRKNGDHFTLPLFLKPNISLSTLGFKLSTSIDVLPNYVSPD